MQIFTREQAYELGRSKFFTGIPCKYGHLAERYVSTGGCVDCLTKRWRVKRNPYTHLLVALGGAPLWVPRELTDAQRSELHRYLQACILNYYQHVSDDALDVDVEQALIRQMER